MSKFNPKKVPKWCKWIAVDENGECYGHECDPTDEISVFGWASKGNICFLYEGKRPKNWKDELYTWS